MNHHSYKKNATPQTIASRKYYQALKNNPTKLKHKQATSQKSSGRSWVRNYATSAAEAEAYINELIQLKEERFGPNLYSNTDPAFIKHARKIVLNWTNDYDTPQFEANYLVTHAQEILEHKFNNPNPLW